MPTDDTTTSPRSFAVSGPIALSVDLGAGEVLVTAGATDQASVTLRPATDGSRDALDLIAKTRVALTGNTLRIDIPRGVGFRRDPAIIVEVAVPDGSSVSAKSGSADVRLSGTFGTMAVTTGSGDVDVDDCADARIRTGSGNARLDQVNSLNATSGSGNIVIGRAGGDVHASTASGDIRATEVPAGGRFKTASGDVEIGSSAGEIEVKTASGDVTVRRAGDGEVEVKTVSGGIVLGVAGGTAVKLDCSSLTGRVSSQLEPVDEPEAAQRRLVVRGRSTSGSITIKRAG